MNLRVAVIQGGPSIEAEVSRRSAEAVTEALASTGHVVERLELDARLPGLLGVERFDVVFPVTHGALGEDGGLQGLLEVLDVPYVGSGVTASALAASKPHAKAQFRAAGLPVVEDWTVRRGAELLTAAREVRAALGPAVVVKPASGGSGLGVTRVAADAPLEQLAAALEHALADDPVALCERFVRGLEVTCGVLDLDTRGPQALPPTQIFARAAEWYDFQSRYAPGGSEHRCPAPLPAPVLAHLQAVAVAAHRALGCRDLSRADFVVGDAEQLEAVTLLEVNTLPGMTRTSLYPEAAGVFGVGFPELCGRLVQAALARPRRAAVNTRAMPGSSAS